MEIVAHCGVKIPIDPQIMSDTIINAIRSGRYEHKEAAEIERLVQPGDRVLEIGGGIGFISTLTGRNANAAAVRVFEANPTLVPFIEKVHALNGVEGVVIENAVLANDVRHPFAPFYLRKDFWASSLSPQPFGYQKVVEVAVKSFGGEIESFQPTFVICDVEGGELDLFMDANLSGVQKVYLEIHQRVIGRRGIKALFDAFSARNFHYDPWHSTGSVVLFSRVTR